MKTISPNLINALNVNRLAAEFGVDGAAIAIWMLATAVRYLTFVGGRDATAAMLEGVMASVCRGEYPEPIHLAGNA